MTDIAEKTKRDLLPSLELAKKLRDSGVRALYVGDGSHKTTAVNINLAVVVGGFRPELSFVELDVASQSQLKNPKETFVAANFYIKTAITAAAGGKTIAVDTPFEPDEPLNIRERVSFKEHSAIADNVVKHLETFYIEHGRLPIYSLTFGRDHFRSKNDLREVIEDKMKERGLPLPKSSAVDVVVRRPQNTSPIVRHHWFGAFDHTVEVSPKPPSGIPDYVISDKTKNFSLQLPKSQQIR